MSGTVFITCLSYQQCIVRNINLSWMCVLFVATVPVSGDYNPASPDPGPAGRSSGTSAHFHGSGGVFPLCAGGPGFDL